MNDTGKISWVCCFVLAAVLTGCATESQETTETIVAAEGGVVALDDSTLSIPAQALASDTAVTLRLASFAGLPALSDAGEHVLAVEPAGTALSVPGTLTLDLAGPVALDRRAIIHQFSDGEWIPRETTVVSGGLLQTSINSLGNFAVVSEPAVVAGNSIEGHLYWGNQEPVAQAPVELFQGDSYVGDTTTDSTGLFRFGDLAPAEYTIRVNYECVAEQTVAVNSSEPAQVSMVLCG